MNTIFLNGWGFSSNHIPSCFPECSSETVSTYSVDRIFQEGKERALAGIRKKLDSESGSALIVGWSLGGMLAIELLATCEHAQRNFLLVIISSSSNYTASEVRRIKALDKLILHVEHLILDPGITALKSFYQDLVREYHLFDVSGPELMHLLHDVQDMSHTGLLNALLYLKSSDLASLASRIKVPSLIIHGEKDMVIPQSHSEKLHLLIPESRLEIIPDSGHMIPFTHSELITSSIKDMIT